MTAQTYYIDPQNGNDSHSGLTPDQPWKTYAAREFLPGDTVLFKRGSVIRDILVTRPGSPNNPITYSAYGHGPKPAFLGSVPANHPALWIQHSPNLWRFSGSFTSEVCNLIFNNGPTCGNLRWNLADLTQQGQWHFTDSAPRTPGDPSPNPTGSLYLYSTSNPASFYSSIEVALWGHRKLVGGKRFFTLDNLSFKYSGVHGYQDSDVHGVTIRNCEFRFIGGAVYDRNLKIRFGNGVEFWDGASDILVEHCIFDKIYDSGITHQGGETRNIPHHLTFRHNLFIDNGMSPYESREPAREVYFEHNTCINAGGEFTMQGQLPPRQSEIYPQPMGHHVFIWKINKNTQPGPVYIRHNIFYHAPNGAAIYSCIDPADEHKFIIDHNCYWQTTGTLLNHMNNKSYLPADWKLYQTETGQDHHSILADPLFVNPAAGDYRLQPNSPAIGKGMA